MKIIKNKFYTSPSDLNNFVNCKYLIQNEIKFLNNKVKKNEETIDQKLWKEFGLKHEKKHFKLLSAKHKNYISIHIAFSICLLILIIILLKLI